jgi:hypothetical protein
MKFAFVCFKIAQNHIQFNIILQILFLLVILNVLDILYLEEHNQFSAIRG